MNVKLRPAPIVKMLIVTVILAVIIIIFNTAFKSLPNHDILMRESSWIFAGLVHLPMFLIPFIIIWFITKGKLKDYGFNLNQEPLFTHKRMLLLGLGFGILMSLKYIPQLINNTPLDVPRPVTLTNVIGTMTFQWIIVGLCEETMFRGLIQTYLMNNLEGTVNMLGHELHIGTVIGAVIWGLFHFINILIMPLRPVIFFVILTAIVGLPMGYAYQKTRSLVTTIIVHNAIFGVPLTIGYLLYWLR